MKRKICVVTGTRAEYGLLYWLMIGIKNDPQLELQVCVTGMHLSPEFGLTYKVIENDGFIIDKKIETLLSSASPVGISKSIGLGVSGFADALQDLQPDILVLLGDRFEILAAAIAATMARIPIAHCHGGEATEGLIDEPIRHSITKMSHLHFTATDEFRKRVIQLGEEPSRVYNVGALGIENINKLSLLDKNVLQSQLGVNFRSKNILVTFHPVTLESSTATEQFTALLQALDELKDVSIIFTLPNADTDGRIIIELIEKYVANHGDFAWAFKSLGQLRYLSCLKYVDAVVGNSSSGLIEVPAFKKATVNIGDRQRGRIIAGSVINCDPTYPSIKGAIETAFSTPFQRKLEQVANPYGTGNSSEKILPVLRDADFSGLIKKRFYNIS